jgi:hypothetical protein
MALIAFMLFIAFYDTGDWVRSAQRDRDEPIVFAPQKGASPAQVRELAEGLERLAAVMARHGRSDLAVMPMGGAAGGLGAGLVLFARAELTSGSDWVLARVGFDAALARADLVLTGEGSFDPTSMAGKVVGEEGAQVSASQIRGPAIIGEGAVVEHSYVGPFTSLGQRCVIRNSELEYSIVFEDTQILDADVRIERSLLGREVLIRRGSSRPKTQKFILGDQSMIELS